MVKVTSAGNASQRAWVQEVDELIDKLRDQLGDLPYDPTPAGLYEQSDLYPDFSITGFVECVDQVIYRRARVSGGPPIAPVEELAQRLHDHGITTALNEFRQSRTLVGVMGGHALARGSQGYNQAVALGRSLALEGYCVTTGGGPGAMEAANLGAATCNLAQADVDECVAQLATVPDFSSEPDAFVTVSLEIVARLGEMTENLSVPTWFYGHEPSNPFATHVAKYFSNSEREDGLLAIALGGIVFVRGGPGTFQEVFQDAAQNAYRTYGPPSPMVFLDPPGESGWWQGSGVLDALAQAFTTTEGEHRSGWDLITNTDILSEVNLAIAARPG